MEKNIVIIGALSTYGPMPDKEEDYFWYKTELADGTIGFGHHYQTNMGGILALAAALKEKNEKIHRMIYLASETVRGKGKEGQISDWTKFMEDVSFIVAKDCLQCESISDFPTDEESLEAAINVALDIDPAKDMVYLDLPGGSRQQMLIMMAITKILEKKGVVICGTLINFFNRDKKDSYKNKQTPVPVVVSANIYHTIDYAHAVETFLNRGDSEQLWQ